MEFQLKHIKKPSFLMFQLDKQIKELGTQTIKKSLRAKRVK